MAMWLRQLTLQDFPVYPRLPPIPTNPYGYVTPPYARLPAGDIEYAIRWARRVVNWLNGKSKRRPGPFNPPSGAKRRRGKHIRRFGLPKAAALGIPERIAPHLPLRLDRIDRNVWFGLPAEVRDHFATVERERLRYLPRDHPAHSWAIPPRRGQPERRQHERARVHTDAEGLAAWVSWRPGD